MPSWTDSERSKMFLAMIELMAPPGSSNKLPSWTHVAERMGSGFTGEAVRQQFQKCRKEGLPRNPTTVGKGSKNSIKRSQSLGGAYSRSSACGAAADDDDEDFALANRKKRIKKEKTVMGGLGLPAADGGLGNSTSGYDEDQTMMNTRARVKMEPGQEQGGFPEGAEGDVGEHNGNRVVGYEELAMMMAHSHGSGMKNDDDLYSRD